MSVKSSVTADPKLLEELMNWSGSRSKRKAIGLTLMEFVRHRRLEELEELSGSDLVQMSVEELEH